MRERGSGQKGPHHERRPVFPSRWALRLHPNEGGGEASDANVTDDDRIGGARANHEREGEGDSPASKRRHAQAFEQFFSDESENRV
jgi:hypothetical protein